MSHAVLRLSLAVMSLKGAVTLAASAYRLNLSCSLLSYMPIVTMEVILLVTCTLIVDFPPFAELQLIAKLKIIAELLFISTSKNGVPYQG